MDTKQGLAPIASLFLALLIAGGLAAWWYTGRDKENGLLDTPVLVESDIPPADPRFAGFYFDASDPLSRCEGYTRVKNADGEIAQFQTTAPRERSLVAGGYELGLRNKFGTSQDVYEYSVFVVQPDGTEAKASGQVSDDDWSRSVYPHDFEGASILDGLYSVIFRIGGKVIACDQFKVTSSAAPSLAPISSSETILIPPADVARFNVYRNEEYGFELRYPAEYGPPQAATLYPRKRDIYIEKAANGMWMTSYRNTVTPLQAIHFFPTGANVYPLLGIQVFKLSDYRFVSIPGGTEYGFDAETDSWWQDSGLGRSPASLGVVVAGDLRGYKVRDGDAGEVYDAILFPDKAQNILVELGINWNHETKRPLSVEGFASAFTFTR